MSVPFTLADALEWTGGTRAGGRDNDAFSGASINTRTLQRGDLFVAIRGDVHDAHAFIPQALEAGAAGVLVESAWLAENPQPEDRPALAVANSTAALGALAAGHRARFDGPVVAITGSNGKTTCKEMCYAILSQAAPCLKNQGNLNNEFGLPLTLLQREADQRSAVVELGMNHRGEIARLTAIAAPDVALITNVGTAHIEHLGSREEIAQEKGDILMGLGPEGTGVLNFDDERVMSQADRVPGKLLRFGRTRGADVTAEDVRFLARGAYAFELKSPFGSASIELCGLAESTVINALAASAATLAAGVPIEQVARGLARHDPIPGRMSCHVLSSSARVIDDSYNANPQSMRNALESLARLKGDGRAVAVLGDMGELGAAADDAHCELGRSVAEFGIDVLFTLGERAAQVAQAAREAGMDPGCVHELESHEAIASDILEWLEESDWALIKGSRSMKMERVVELLASKGAE